MSVVPAVMPVGSPIIVGTTSVIVGTTSVIVGTVPVAIIS